MSIQFVTENGVPFVEVNGSRVAVTPDLIEQGQEAAAESELMFIEFIHEWTLSVDDESKANLVKTDEKALQEAFLNYIGLKL